MTRYEGEFKAPEGDVLSSRIKTFNITTDDPHLQGMLSHLWRCIRVRGGTIVIDSLNDDSDVYRFNVVNDVEGDEVVDRTSAD